MNWEGYERCYWIWDLTGVDKVHGQISSESKAINGKYDWLVDIESGFDNGIVEVGSAESFEDAARQVQNFLAAHGIILESFHGPK